MLGMEGKFGSVGRKFDCFVLFGVEVYVVQVSKRLVIGKICQVILVFDFFIYFNLLNGDQFCVILIL